MLELSVLLLDAGFVLDVTACVELDVKVPDKEVDVESVLLNAIEVAELLASELGSEVVEV